MNNPRLLLGIGAVILLGVATALVLLGRALRSRLGEPGRSSDRPNAGQSRDWAVTPLPTGMARTLTERGLVNAQQLAGMSPAERDFFVATVAARIGEGVKPKLVASPTPGASRTPPAAPSDGTASAHAGGASDAGRSPDAAAGGDSVATAALVSGPVHCPVCRAQLAAERSETPLLMSRCPGCGRRIGFRVEGNRLTITVQYGAPTPAAGVAIHRRGAGS